MSTDAIPATGMHPLLPGAVALHQAGRIEAISQYEKVLADLPEQFDALHMMGVIALQEGRFEEAQNRIAAALRGNPDNAPALGNITVAFLRNRQFEQALQWGQRALKADPESTDTLINLGTTLHEMGRFEEAAGILRQARDFSPNSALICNLLGSCLLNLGEARGAAEAFEAATVASPSDADSWANLSTALNSMSEHQAALAAANKSIELRADSSSALAAQAASLLELGKVDEAIASYRDAVKHSPTIKILCAFANALITSGLNDEAAECLRRAIEMDGSNPSARWILAISILKPIYESHADVLLAREKLSVAMTELMDWFKSSASPIAYQAVGATQPFFIAYHEFNNRDLLTRYGRLCASWMTSLHAVPQASREPMARTGKMRIGMASAHVRDHSVWIAIAKGWATRIDRKKFEIFVFSLSPQSDKETLDVKRNADFFDGESKSVEGWIDSIKKSNLDILIYPGIGMDPLGYQLASLRLAPIQAASWGHPETSGLPEMDYYLSGEALEPADAQANYSEKLVRLPNFGAFVEPLEPKIKNVDRRELGLPKGVPLLLCPGTPFKYMPIHDSVWISIAKGLKDTSDGRLVFFASSRGSMHVTLLARLRKSFSIAGVDFDTHVCVIPMLDRARFFSLMQQSTLLLDTLGFSGFNTALQGLECGLPVLAYEGEFMRGRLASAIMRKMEMPELVATSHQEFIQKAVDFSADPKRLKKIRSQIPKRVKSLFRDDSSIRALEDFLETEIRRQRAGHLKRLA
jgi:predicted O-linked N-acetylglucosamine transferase (SPINDLY family)